MAERLSTHEFSTNRGKHNWDEWLDGSIWQLEPGTDFTSKTSSLRASAVKQASNRNKQLNFEVLDNGSVVLQAV